jgi:acyl-coenzyme A thioesterase PaaI-like protein
MNLPADLATLSGLDQLRAVFAGRTGYEGIVKTLDRRPASVEEGFVVFERSFAQTVYNPCTLHGGYPATLLGSVMSRMVISVLHPPRHALSPIGSEDLAEEAGGIP